MKATVIIFRVLLLLQFALFLSELLQDVRVFVYTYRFHRPYQLFPGSCLAETFTWRNGLSIAVLSLALVSVIGLAGFRRWSRVSYLLFFAMFLALLPLLGPYDLEIAAVAVVVASIFAVTAAFSFSRFIRDKFKPKVA